MKEDLHNIDRLFKNAINEHEEMPSGDVWNKLENNLDKNDAINYRKKNNGLKRLSVLLLLLLTGVTVYIFNAPKRTKIIQTPFAVKSTPGNTNSSNEKENKNIIQNNSASSEIKEKNNETKVIADKTINNINTDKISTDNNKIQLEKKQAVIKTDNNLIKNHKATIQKGTLQKDEKDGFNNTDDISISQKKLSDNDIVKSKKEIKITRNKITAKISGSEVADMTNEKKGNINIENEKLDIDTSNVSNDGSTTIEKKKATSLAAATKPTEAEKTSLVKKKDLKKKQSAFSMNIFYSPDFAFYHLKNEHERDDDDPNEHHDEDKYDIDQNEDHGSAFTMGATVDYNFSKHWSLQSGIAFSKTNINSNAKKIYAQLDNSTGKVQYKYNASSGYAFVSAPVGNTPEVGDSIEASRSVHTTTYIAIPLAIKYNLSYKKFDFNILAGISTNFLIDGEMEASFKGNNQPSYVDKCQFEGLKKIYFSGSAGVGAAYNFNNRLALTFNPTARFALNSINKNVTVRSYPISFGLSTGLRFKF